MVSVVSVAEFWGQVSSGRLDFYSKICYKKCFFNSTFSGFQKRPKKVPKSDFQSQCLMSNIIWIFPVVFHQFYENTFCHLVMLLTLFKNIKTIFKTLCFLKIMPNILTTHLKVSESRIFLVNKSLIA